MRRRKVIFEWYWHAFCSCGWSTTVRNDADTVGNKVRNHLMTFHPDNGAEITITAHEEVRQEGQLPATGTPVAEIA